MEASPEINAVLKARFEQLAADYEAMRRNLAAAQKRIQTLTGSAETSDHTVRVEVDFRGNLTGVHLEPRAYNRYSPTLLGEQILRLAKEATAQVTESMAGVMAPFLPSGVNYADLVSGDTDMSVVAMDTPLTNENYDQWRARFSGHQTTDPNSEA